MIENQPILSLVFQLASSAYWLIWLLLFAWFITWIIKRIIRTARM